jgi:hypothetical protein
VGDITSVDSSGVAVRFLVEARPNSSDVIGPGGDKIWFTVAGPVFVVIERTGDFLIPDGAPLVVGRRAAVVTHGPIAESYPAQARADTTVILVEPR